MTASLSPNYFFRNWQRKLLSLIVACLIWIIVHNSISNTINICNIPVKVVHLPPNQAIKGMGSDGILAKKLSLRISGERNLLAQLNARELFIEISAEGKPDIWKPEINLNNLRSFDSHLDLSGISSVKASPFELHQELRINAKIAITILRPNGDPPNGYHFIDVWPRTLYHTVSGPADAVEELKSQGITLFLDLEEIKAADLNAIQSVTQKDEVSYFVPSQFRRINIPFLKEQSQEINDPKAQNLRVDFLHSEVVPINSSIPVLLYFAQNEDKHFTPQTIQLAETLSLLEKNGSFTLAMPLFAYNVSRRFLEIVKNSLAVVLVLDPIENHFSWSLQVIDSNQLENLYLEQQSDRARLHLDKTRERYLRQRFRDYLNSFQLYTKNKKPLKLDISLKGNLVYVRETPSE